MTHVAQDIKPAVALNAPNDNALGTLIANGYSPVALCGKRPLGTGWQSRPNTVAATIAEAAAIGGDNWGLRTGSGSTVPIAGIDIDDPEPGRAIAVAAIVGEHCGPTPLVRIGKKGGMHLYHTPDPFSKMSVTYANPSETDRKRRTKPFEILGTGQQLVAFGTHPDTGRAYEWIGTDGDGLPTSPLDCPAAGLPSLTEDGARAVLAAVAGQYRAWGCQDVQTHDGARDAQKPAAQSTGEPVPEACLRAMLARLDPDMERDDWLVVLMALHAAPVAGGDPSAVIRRGLAVEWSRGDLHDFKPSLYLDDTHVTHQFNSVPPKEGGINVGTLIQMAREAGYTGLVTVAEGRTAEEIWQDNPHAKAGPGGSARTGTAGGSADYPPPLTMRDLVARDFPVPTFAVQDMILARTLNMMWGDGGTGKTSLCLHLAVAVAAGVPVFGLAVRQMPVLLVLKEDDYGPTKQRLAAICARLFHVALDDLPIALSCLPASDLTLATIDDRGQDSAGPFLKPLAGFVRAMGDGDKLVILDPVGDFAALDENRRAPVNTFCKDVIGATLCSGLGATVLVTGHPSKTGMADGSGYGGTTAWKNSVRAMTVFKRTNMEDLTDPARVWTMQKGNYGPPRTLDLTAEFPAANEVLFRHGAEKATLDILRIVADAAIMAYDAGSAIVRNQAIPDMVGASIKRRAQISMRPKQIKAKLWECVQADLLRYQAAPDRSHPGRGRTPRAGFRAFDRIEDKPYDHMAPSEERAHSSGA